MSLACWKRAACCCCCCCCCWACWKRLPWLDTTPCDAVCCSAFLAWGASWNMPHCIWTCDWKSCCFKFSNTCCCWSCCCCWICCFWICCWCWMCCCCCCWFAMGESDWIGRLQKPLALRCLTASSSWETSSEGKSCSCCCWGAASPHSLLAVTELLLGLSWLRPSLASRRNCWEPCCIRESPGTEKVPVAAMSCFWMVLKGSVWVKTGAWPLSGSPAGWDSLLDNDLLLFRCPAVMSVFCWAGQSSLVC